MAVLPEPLGSHETWLHIKFKKRIGTKAQRKTKNIISRFIHFPKTWRDNGLCVQENEVIREAIGVLKVLIV